MEETRLVYNDRVARQFVLASMVWGVVAMLVGLFIALELTVWQANLAPALSFGRLRPVHVNAVVFAFIGNMVFAGIYYSSQRLLKTRASDALAAIHFWGWQLVILAAVITLPLGFTQGKEYAELEWPIDVAVAGVWIVFAVQLFTMVKRRHERQLYVSIWFYIATVLVFTLLYVVGSLAVPVGALKSYSAFGGVVDAIVHWWYGHNTIAFFLTMPALGLMYFLAPVAAGGPLHSYRLAVLHFWALVLLYVWAGPHHLLNTAVPDWAQSLGMVFGLLLWAPSWGGALNGLFTLRGAASKNGDPAVKFLVAAILFYALATLEGPILSIKSVSAVAHYTDWVVGHAHASALGWNGFLAAALFYWMVPRLYGTHLHSRAAASAHFYLATLGIAVYVASMWIAGATQGLMWRAENPGGGLTYGFIEALTATDLLHWTRLAGGLMYLLGFLLMGWNLYRTVKSGRAVDGDVLVTIAPRERPPVRRVLIAQPVIIAAAVIALAITAGLVNPIAAMAMLLVAFLLALGGIAATTLRDAGVSGWHQTLERRGLGLSVLIALALATGTAAEILPFVAGGPRAQPGLSAPYSALELEGRDIYVREGCVSCHSQMIRPYLWEVARYGEVSDPGESAYDHPFQWGSRRIGPDLARVGGKYPNVWHYQHMVDPRAVSVGSNMPAYSHLVDAVVDLDGTSAKMDAMRSIGVPYADSDLSRARESALAQGGAVARDLDKAGQPGVHPDSEMVALIAYLQRLGQPPLPPEPP